MDPWRGKYRASLLSGFFFPAQYSLLGRSPGLLATILFLTRFSGFFFRLPPPFPFKRFEGSRSLFSSIRTPFFLMTNAATSRNFPPFCLLFFSWSFSFLFSPNPGFRPLFTFFFWYSGRLWDCFFFFSVFSFPVDALPFFGRPLVSVKFPLEYGKGLFLLDDFLGGFFLMQSYIFDWPVQGFFLFFCPSFFFLPPTFLEGPFFSVF